ncbi:MAG: hypothetical protein HY364_02600 [Candidatus Aenigmarchaeota archaeon]|nr:hypothetical protein [Candidatus Aenigmarchaeota archaeon]
MKDRYADSGREWMKTGVISGIIAYFAVSFAGIISIAYLYPEVLQNALGSIILSSPPAIINEAMRGGFFAILVMLFAEKIPGSGIFLKSLIVTFLFAGVIWISGSLLIIGLGMIAGLYNYTLSMLSTILWSLIYAFSFSMLAKKRGLEK